MSFWGRKNVFRNKNIYDCKRHVNVTNIRHFEFLRQKLSEQTGGRRDGRRDGRTKNANRESYHRDIIGFAFFTLDFEWPNGAGFVCLYLIGFIRKIMSFRILFQSGGDIFVNLSFVTVKGLEHIFQVCHKTVVRWLDQH